MRGRLLWRTQYAFKLRLIGDSLYRKRLQPNVEACATPSGDGSEWRSRGQIRRDRLERDPLHCRQLPRSCKIGP
jgi:hypothetical protein